MVAHQRPALTYMSLSTVTCQAKHFTRVCGMPGTCLDNQRRIGGPSSEGAAPAQEVR